MSLTEHYDTSEKNKGNAHELHEFTCLAQRRLGRSFRPTLRKHLLPYNDVQLRVHPQGKGRASTGEGMSFVKMRGREWDRKTINC